VKRLLSSFMLVLFCCLQPLRADTTLKTDVLLKAVVFIYSPNSDGTEADTTKPIGTGFLVLARSKGAAAQGIVILITARHIVDPWWATCSAEPQQQPDRRIFLRVNKTNYDPKKDATGVDYEPLDLVRNGVKRYSVSGDSQVDAAIVDAVSFDRAMQQKYDFAPLELASLASADEIAKFKIGDSIASPGLVPGRSGEM